MSSSEKFNSKLTSFSDMIRGVWATIDDTSLLPLSETCPELLKDPMVFEKVSKSGVIGRLFLAMTME